MPRHKNEVNSIRTRKLVIFEPHTENKSASIPALKPSQFRSIYENLTIIGPNTTTSISTPLKQHNFDAHIKTKSISIPNTNLVNFDPITKIKSISIPLKYQVDYDAPTQKPS